MGAFLSAVEAERHARSSPAVRVYRPGMEPADRCWLPDQAERLINYVKKIDLINGSGIKKVSEAELFESTWRADPSDGLRPLKKTRYEIEK